MTEYLSLEDLLLLSHQLGHNRVLDLGLLAAAAERSRARLYRVDAYPSVEGKAAVLLESLLRAPGLASGNSALAWLAVVVFLGLNGLRVTLADSAIQPLLDGVRSGSLDWHEAESVLAAGTERLGAS